MSNPVARQLRRTILVALLLFIGGVLSITAYTLWRLRSDTLVNGLEMAAMHSRSFEQLFTQSLHVTELLTVNTLEQLGELQAQALDQAANRLDGLGTMFSATLSRAPYLRSMSLLGKDGRILASSNRANVGLLVATRDYLPRSSGALDLLRIGAPWTGRDFSDGQPSSALSPAKPDAPGFLPVLQTMTLGTRAVTLLVALNPDYFINHMMQNIQTNEGVVDVLRYDGALLLSTNPDISPGGLPDYVMSELHLGEAEAGRFERKVDDGRAMLTAFRASRLYPIVIVTQIRRDFALQHWRAEASTLLGALLLMLLAVGGLVWAFYRRQLQYLSQRVEAQRLQRINATVFDASTEAMLITDVYGVVISINQAFSRVTGYASQDVIGRPLLGLLSNETIAAFDAADTPLPSFDDPGVADHSAIAAPLEAALIGKKGEQIWTEILSTPEYDSNGKIVGYHRICRNISERKQMEDQIRQLAFFDPLTQLANRRLMGDRLEQAMVASKRSGRYGALMFLDLDNFKPLNDEHGHEVGDLLLREVADRLRHCVREIDTVARFGGDEFIVMLSSLGSDREDSLAQARLIGEKIRTTLSMPYQLTVRHPDQHQVHFEHRCSASVGVVLFCGHGATLEELVSQADAAMYRAKDSGRNRVFFAD